MHDEVGLHAVRRGTGLGRRARQIEHYQLAAEDLLVAGEGLAGVAGEGQVGTKRHDRLLVRGSLVFRPRSTRELIVPST